MSDANKMRDPVPEQFEEAVKRAAVEHYGYGQSDALLKTLLDRNLNGRFAVDWVNGFLLGWQASRQAVVVELPDRKDGKYCDLRGFNEVLFSADVGATIEAQGLRCEVKS